MLLTMLMSAAIAGASPPPQDKPQDGGIVVTGEKNKKDKRVCKRSVPTGSVMPKVTCRTASEWAAEDVRNQTAMERMRGDQRSAEAAYWEKKLAGK